MSGTKHIIAEVNEKLKHQFKVTCAQNKESQKDAISRSLQHYVETSGKLKGVKTKTA